MCAHRKQCTVEDHVTFYVLGSGDDLQDKGQKPDLTSGFENRDIRDNSQKDSIVRNEQFSGGQRETGVILRDRLSLKGTQEQQEESGSR